MVNQNLEDPEAPFIGSNREVEGGFSTLNRLFEKNSKINPLVAESVMTIRTVTKFEWKKIKKIISYFSNQNNKNLSSARWYSNIYSKAREALDCSGNLKVASKSFKRNEQDRMTDLIGARLNDWCKLFSETENFSYFIKESVETTSVHNEVSVESNKVSVQPQKEFHKKPQRKGQRSILEFTRPREQYVTPIAEYNLGPIVKVPKFPAVHFRNIGKKILKGGKLKAALKCCSEFMYKALLNGWRDIRRPEQLKNLNELRKQFMFYAKAFHAFFLPELFFLFPNTEDIEEKEQGEDEEGDDVSENGKEPEL